MQRLCIVLIGCLTSCQSIAQWQLGVFGGISNYQGDLVDKPYGQSKGAFGLTVGYQISPRVNLRAGITFAKISGADSLSTSEVLRLRNLNFQSPITEFSFIGEFNTFDMEVKNWSPYVFGGLAVFHFNPYTMDQSGNQIFLQALSTEGQGLPGYPQSKQYSLTQLSIPFGGGIKYNIGENVRIALEVGLRKTFTDFLDDVSGNYADQNELLVTKGQRAVDFSYRGDEVAGGDPAYPSKGTQRGSPKYKDYYYFSGIHLVFKLPEGAGGGRSYSYGGKHKNYGCPTVF